ncbi:MAG: hypothetical protein J0L92_14890 [Deltaproteobacteria bacterium]|nr:hypothetical protein [Deltaproteobacteria bacterium]
MFRGDATSEIARLERGLRDAQERFLHAPGGLWLAASATLEAITRLDPTLLDQALRDRVERLAHDARRMKQDGDARASQHELSALAEWVELARHRAAHEELFVGAAAAAPRRFTSRGELAELIDAEQRALESLARDPGPPLSTATEALVATLRAHYPEYDPHALPDELVLARGREAQRELLGPAAPRKDQRTDTTTWRVSTFPTSNVLLGAAMLTLALTIGAFAYFGALGRMAAVFSVGVGLVSAGALLGAAIVRRRAEMSRRTLLLEAWGFRAKSSRAFEQARAKHEHWTTVARTLGQLDAFRRSEQGVALEAREHRLPALAPWVRTLVGGLDDDAARRFE